ncbi:MAG: Ribose transport system permease protein RbsC [Planctomycetota bacterium]|jgi:ribose transport system permease protein
MTPARERLARILDAAGPVLALLAVVVVLRLAVGPDLLGFRNIQNVLTQAVIVATGAVGMTVIIVAGGIDLSCGAVIALCAVVAARVLAAPADPGPDAGAMAQWWAWLAALPDWTAIPLAIAVGLAVGLLNGGLITGLRQLPFIVTLGMMGVARGAAKWQADERTVAFDAPFLTALMARPRPPAADAAWWSWIQAAPAVWILLALAVAASLLMHATVLGRRFYAVGSNEAAARLCGIRVPWVKIAAYAIGGACFGWAGALSAARLSVGDPTTAVGLELDIIAAVIVGGASLGGGSGTVAGAVVGALLMAWLRNGSLLLGWPPYTQEMLIGSAIVAAVGIDRWRRRGRA